MSINIKKDNQDNNKKKTSRAKYLESLDEVMKIDILIEETQNVIDLYTKHKKELIEKKKAIRS
jgi:hypothetical protein